MLPTMRVLAALAVSLLSFGIATGLWLGARADSGIAVQGGPGAGRVVYQRWFLAADRAGSDLDRLAP